MSVLDASLGAASTAVLRNTSTCRRGHHCRKCVTTWSRPRPRAVHAGGCAQAEPEFVSRDSGRWRGDVHLFRHGVGTTPPRNAVRCRANSKERQAKDEELKKYLREKGVQVPATRKQNAGPPEDPFEAVDLAIEKGGFSSLRLLDLDTVREKWDVPWGGWRVFLGMSGWTASFVLTAALVFPALLIANGVDPRQFDSNEQSKYLVAVQLIETLETFLVLWLLLRKFAPEMEGKEFFKVRISQAPRSASLIAHTRLTLSFLSQKLDPADDPFSIEKGWLTWGVIGYVMVFFAIGFTATAIDLGTHAFEELSHAGGAQEVLRRAGDAANGVAGVASDTASGVASQAASVTAASSSPAAAAAKDQGPGTIDAVLPLLRSGEGSAGRFVSVLTVTSVLAPLLEEVVFRGFLLVSLTKWLPTPGAVLFSSVIFGAAHFAPRDFPQLVTLGIVLGFSYARTRNLLTPMFIHSLWNSGVLIVVAGLVATGNEAALPGMGGG